MKAATLLCVVLVVFGVVKVIDARAADPRTEPASAPAGRPPTRAVLHPGSGRVFVLLIDSLRYQTATDPTVMPALVGLRERSTYAKTKSCRDAVTVSALRAAFTGRDGFSVLGFVDNFWRGDAGLDSIFSQAKEAGVRTVIASDGSFDQFGVSNADQLPNELGSGDDETTQDAAARQALDVFVDGAYDLAVSHVTYGDIAAHRYGVDAPEYREAFGKIDALVHEIDAAISEDDTLVVMGDHGHDERGRHALGLDVPTFSLYRGPGFRHGADLGTIAIAEHRYLSSWALGLGLDAHYAEGRHSTALVSMGPLVDPWREEVPSNIGDEASGATLAPKGAATVSTILRVAPLCLAWAALAFATLWILGTRDLGPSRRRLFAAAGMVALAFALFGWGWMLAHERVRIHEPELGSMAYGWRIAVALLVGASVVLGPMRVGWALLGVTSLLFYPTAYRYGAPGTMAIVWFTVLASLSLRWMLTQFDLHRRGAAVWSGKALLTTLGLPLAAMALLVPYFFPKAANFHFQAWEGFLAVRAPWKLVALSAAAKAYLLARPLRYRDASPRWCAGLAVLSVVTVLACAEAGVFSLEGRAGGLGVAALVGAAVMAGRSDRDPRLTRVLWLSALFGAFASLVRVPLEARATLSVLLAALSLSATFVVRVEPDRARRRGLHLFLVAMGVLASGWGTLAWTTHRLEWGFLYDWLSHTIVEHHVGLFVPIIFLRYTLVVILARTILEDELGEAAPTRAALGLVAAKILALAIVMAGIGYHSALTNVYLEAVQECAIFVVLAIGLAPRLEWLRSASRVKIGAWPSSRSNTTSEAPAAASSIASESSASASRS